jgi:hypothetical protein
LIEISTISFFKLHFKFVNVDTLRNFIDLYKIEHF